jgi:hypothetical protein
MKSTHSIAKFIALSAAALGLSACAPLISGTMNLATTDADVAHKTARYFGVTEQELAISHIEKGVLVTNYQTRHAGKFYNCTIYYGEVACKQPGS